MKIRHLAGASAPAAIAAAALAAGILGAAAPASAQTTTVIETHRSVPAPGPRAVIVHRESATTSSSSSHVETTNSPPPRRVVVVRHRVPVRHRVVHHAAPVRVVHRTVVVHDVAPPEPRATVDRRTVIHRDETGEIVGGHTTVVRHNPDGTTDVNRRPLNDGPR